MQFPDSNQGHHRTEVPSRTDVTLNPLLRHEGSQPNRGIRRRVPRAMTVLLFASVILIPLIGCVHRPAARNPREEPNSVHVFGLHGYDFEGAEIWINGVCLGRTPVNISWREFKEKVPVWDSPPENYDDPGDKVKIPDYRFPDRYFEHRRWITCEILPPTWSRGFWSYETERNYYVRCRFGDEWGYFGSPGPPGLPIGLPPGPYPLPGEHRRSASGEVRTHLIPVTFQGIEKRIEKLLDLARVSDYRVGPSWFEAFNSYGHYGRRILASTAGEEPGFERVIDDWLFWEYGIGPEDGPEAAWPSFERICAVADERGYYDSLSVDGFAVERIVPRLDPVQLSEHAVEEIGKYRKSNQLSRFFSSPSDFRYSSRLPGTPPTYEPIPAGFAVLGHAVNLMDRRLDEEEPDVPNAIEAAVTPALIDAERERRGPDLAAILEINGPAADEFFLSQDWRSTDEEDLVGYWHPSRVNGWLLCLAKLDTPAGKRFRLGNRKEILALAETMVVRRLSGVSLESAGFLFLDNELGEKSPASEFLPAYYSIIERELRDYERFNKAVRYLALMEPAPTVEMYVDAMHRFLTANSGIPVSDLRSLPKEKQKAILEAWKRELTENRSDYENRKGSRPDEDYYPILMVNFEEKMRQFALTEEDRARERLEYCRSHPFERIAKYYAQNPVDSPLFVLLARDEMPSMRIFVLEALEQNPTPRNRALLDELLNDPDASVRRFAEEVLQNLDELAASPPSEFALNSLKGET